MINTTSDWPSSSNPQPTCEPSSWSIQKVDPELEYTDINPIDRARGRRISSTFVWIVYLHGGGFPLFIFCIRTIVFLKKYWYFDVLSIFFASVNRLYSSATAPMPFVFLHPFFPIPDFVWLTLASSSAHSIPTAVSPPSAYNGYPVRLWHLFVDV